jgi:hypothetical protein
MESKDRLDELYANCFADQPEGHFLYHPISSVQLKAGVCGFFDHMGDWQTVADLTKPEDLEKEGYSSAPNGYLDVADTRELELGPRISRNIQRVSLGKNEYSTASRHPPYTKPDIYSEREVRRVTYSSPICIASRFVVMQES